MTEHRTAGELGRESPFKLNCGAVLGHPPRCRDVNSSHNFVSILPSEVLGVHVSRIGRPTYPEFNFVPSAS